MRGWCMCMICCGRGWYEITIHKFSRFDRDSRNTTWSQRVILHESRIMINLWNENLIFFDLRIYNAILKRARNRIIGIVHRVT